MKALLIGGTGNISLWVTRRLLQEGWEVVLLNRGNAAVEGARSFPCDINAMTQVKEEELQAFLAKERFDVVAQFIAYKKEQVLRDIRLFAGHTRQYIFISTASAYQKPLSSPVINEGTPLSNPFWQYSRDKIACEDALMQAYRETGFPLTIVRPSHTYGDGRLPVALHGGNPSQVVKRILNNQPVPIPGDGTSLWTLTHAEDFARGFVGLMGNAQALGESVHITSDESLTWNQIYRTIASLLDRELHPLYIPSQVLSKVSSYDFAGGLWGDKANTVLFDNSKLKRLVPGFAARIPFAQGARRVLDNYLSNPEEQKEDAAFDAFCNQAAALMAGLEGEFSKL